MKTSELTGVALDWAVATAEELDYFEPEIGPMEPAYSTDWSQGGPIIERERITTHCDTGVWIADGYWPHISHNIVNNGPTPLIAAMRCFVSSRLGDEVDIPAELKD